jgi:hypothetical protein
MHKREKFRLLRREDLPVNFLLIQNVYNH